MRILKRSSSPNVTPGRHSPGHGSPGGHDSSPTSPRLLMGGKNSAFKALNPFPKTSDSMESLKPYIRPEELKNYQSEALKSLQDASSSFLHNSEALKSLQSNEALKNYFHNSEQFKYSNLLGLDGSKAAYSSLDRNGGIDSNDSLADSDEEINVNDESDEEKERQYIEMLKREREKMEMDKAKNEKDNQAHSQPLELTTRDRDKS